jgi:predicted enzyme related to lactoylglutathione lyase
MIKEIAFTAYPAKDVAGLRKWYEETLGIPFSAPYVEDGVEQYNEANVGNGYFSLMTIDWMQAAPGSGNGLAFEVTDLDRTIADLKGKGVSVEDPYETPVCKLAVAQDLEGNRVVLHQITVPH